MRPMWSGAISFGLIYIPVNMFKATEDRHPGFHLVAGEDHCPIKYTKVCKYTNKEVPYNKISKSYEYDKGKTVLIEEEDLKKAYSKRSETIKVIEFVKIDQVLPKYFQQPYYLEPQKGAQDVYALLAEALVKTGKAGITRYTLHNLEHLGILQSEGAGLVLNQIRYDSEFREPGELSIPKYAKKDKAELELAVSLIEKLTKDFEPSKYKDSFKQDLDRIIRSKVKEGKTLVLEETDPGLEKGEVLDLMERLKASLGEQGKKAKDAS